MLPDNTLEKDSYGRKTYSKPSFGALNVYNRAHMFQQGCLTNHINDLINTVFRCVFDG